MYNYGQMLQFWTEQFCRFFAEQAKICDKNNTYVFLEIQFRFDINLSLYLLDVRGTGYF